MNVRPIYSSIAHIFITKHVLFLPVEDEKHCDFVKLREMLVRTNMEDLRTTTHDRHYELYRRCKLQEMGLTDSESMR